jgi:hypothetical protein
MLNLHRLASCTLLYSSSLLLACSRVSTATTTRNCSEPSWSLTYIATERTCITGNTYHVIAIQPVYWRKLHGHTAITCHVTATYCCVTSPRTRKTQLPLLLRVGTCLKSYCLAKRWSNPLQCIWIFAVSFCLFRQILEQRQHLSPLISNSSS